MVKKLRIQVILILLLVAFLTGCASIDEARKLHQDGQNTKALKMAEKLLDDGEEEPTRIAAINLIGEINDQRSGEILLPVMNDESVNVKNAAIRTIGRLRYEPASSRLIKIAYESSGDTKEEAAIAIRKIGPPAIDLLVKKFNGASNETDRDKYKQIMLLVGPSVATSIAKNLEGKSYFENRTNFDLLIMFKNPDVANWLIKDIDNPQVADMVEEGLIKLGRLAETAVMDKLQDLSEQPGDISAKERLITVLGEIKATKAVSLLESLTTDDSDRIRNAADLALKKIRGF